MDFIIRHKKTSIAVIIFILLATRAFVGSATPNDFVSGTKLNIPEGSTVKGVATILKENHIIRSEIYFALLIELSRSHAVAGSYIFKEPENLYSVVKRVAMGDYETKIYQITLFEGMTAVEMAKTVKYYIPDFNDAEFLTLAKSKEGYLFPDTYKISELITPTQLMKILQDNFKSKIDSISDQIKNSKYSLDQIIIMASIVEKEASADTKQEVADILWARYEAGIPLQVDAPFVYSIGKSTFDLTKDDLSSDDPYNTYKNLGLVPTPISNPGLDSIKAAAHPRATSFLFFLTGRDGNMYFAKTFEEHKKNRLRYLN